MRFLPIALLLAALIVVVWLAGGLDLLGGSGPDVDEAEFDRTAATPDGEGPPALVGHGSSLSTAVPGRGAIRGRVVWRGEGVVAEVSLRVVADMRAQGPLGRVEPHWLYEAVIGTGSPLAVRTSAADGRFAFEAVKPGRYEVRARGATGEQASVALDLPAPATRASVRIELPSGSALLRGRARYADGRPFVGFLRLHYDDAMTVNVDPFRAHVDWGTGCFSTVADGSFLIRGVPEGEVRLAALVPGERRYLSAPVTLPHAGTYEFVVDDGCEELTGEVSSLPGGEPVARARIEISGDRAPQGSVRRVVYTNAEGRFRVRIPVRHVHVRVDAPHHAGRYLGDGQTDYASVTWSDTSSSSHGWGARDPLELPPDRHLVLQLPRTARVRGVVRKADDGAPVPDVPVFAVSSSGHTAGSVATATTDAEGRYDVPDAPPGEVVVFVAGKGWVIKDLAWAASRGTGATSRIELLPGGEATLDVGVVPAVGLRGRVRDADGAPVADAAVLCRPSVVDPKAIDFPFGRLASPAWLGSATTDPEGRFAFDTLLPSFPYQIHVLHPDHPRHASPPVRAREAGWTEVEVTLPITRGVAVRVVDAATGEGIRGAQVSLGSGFDAQVWTTDDNGRAWVDPIDTSDHWVWARAPGYAGLQQAGKLGAAKSGETEELVIALAKGVWVSGRVVTPEGVSPADVHVSPALAGSWGARTEPDGSFRCGPVPAGPLELRAYLRVHGRSITHKVRVTAPADGILVDVRSRVADATENTPPQPTWTLDVVGPDGRPVARARCRVWGIASSPGEASRTWRMNGQTATVREGHASLRLHQAGIPQEAWIAVWDAEALPGEGAAPGAVSAHPVLAEGGAVRVELPAGRTIEGVMRWADGTPAAGATVRAFDASPSIADGETWREEQRGDTNLWRAHALDVCDSHGAFRLRGLADGPYAVVPVLPPDALVVEMPVVTAGEGDVRIVLERGVAPTLTVLSPDGMPVASCDVVLLLTDVASPRRVSQATTNGAGRARLPGLEAGRRYQVLIERPSGREDLLPMSLSAWTPRDETVVLQRAFEVSGTVDTVLRPPTNALRVHYRILGQDDERRFWRMVWAEGTPPRFRIPDLGEGDVLLILVGKPEGKSDPRALRVAAGTTDLVLPP